MRPIFTFVFLLAVWCDFGLYAQESSLSQPPLPEVRKEIIAQKIREAFEEKVYSHRSTYANSPEMKKQGTEEIDAFSEIALSGIGEHESEMHAAVNPVDSNNIVVSAIREESTGGFTLSIYYTKNFGKTWKRSNFHPGAQGQGGGDPIFAFDANGTLYYSWIELYLEQSFNEGLFFSSSTDGGETWSQIDTLAWNNEPGALGNFLDKQWMAVDRSNSPYRNTLYTVYLNIDQLTMFVRKKPAGSKAFVKQSVRASDASFVDLQFSSISVDATGNVHVFFWGRKSLTELHSLWHSVSTNGGQSFSSATRIAGVRCPLRDVTAPYFLPARTAALPQFAVDSYAGSPHQGSLYAVWCSNDLSVQTSPTYNEPLHIYFCFSTNGGKTWSTPVRLNTDNPVFRADHFQPSIDVNSKGMVIVTWYDGRSAANNTNVHCYTAYSTDGGKTFSANLQVSGKASNITPSIQGSFGIGDYTKVVSTSGYAIPIWADGRKNDGSVSVYAAFIPLGTGSTDVERLSDISTGTELYAISPNPVAATGDIRFRIAHAESVTLEIINVDGKVVQSLSGQYEPGEHTVTLHCSDLASGQYIYRLRTPSSVLSHTMAVLR